MLLDIINIGAVKSSSGADTQKILVVLFASLSPKKSETVMDFIIKSIEKEKILVFKFAIFFG